MSGQALGILARVHGIVAWIATAALLAAAFVASWRPLARRLGAAVSVVAVLSISIAGGLGLLLEEPYRARIRQRLFVASPALGWLFERKEHLAFGAVLLGWSALFARLAARPGALAGELRRAALVGWTASAVFALAAAAASAIVARRAGF